MQPGKESLLPESCYVNKALITAVSSDSGSLTRVVTPDSAATTLNLASYLSTWKNKRGVVREGTKLIKVH